MGVKIIYGMHPENEIKHKSLYGVSTFAFADPIFADEAVWCR
jgi:hypothetical protein